ncbi:Retrovirus-related Pol polyprotein from transposon 17.6 [Orchesella cincta]|uniref:RNA-directed DNA polymerase n=1 Tax=Orchesella cincta TaxID=48709 RepID=A0A1D2M491_ORCCI|nr:Retrovirus-related Pol polyprotein from transposon 17.6 [Orchesella cincta]
MAQARRRGRPLILDPGDEDGAGQGPIAHSPPRNPQVGDQPPAYHQAIPIPPPLPMGANGIEQTSDVKIPTYAGSHDTRTPYDYLLELEKYSSVIGYTEDDMLRHVVPLSLINDAYNWYRYEPEFQDWPDFKARLRREFQAIGYTDDLRRELDNRYQGLNETLTTFIRIIIDYLQRIGDIPAEADIVQKIKRLMHPDYRKALIGMPSETLDELKASALKAQELIKSYRSYKLPPITGSLEPSLAWKPVNTSILATKEPKSLGVAADVPRNAPRLHYAAVDPYSYYHNSNAKKEVRIQTPTVSSNPGTPQRSRSSSPHPNANIRQRSVSPFRNERQCYRCNSPGHFVRDCPIPQRGITPPPGTSRDNMLIDSESDEEIATISMPNRDNRPLMKVKMVQQEFNAFLDTGSSISVVGDEIISILNTEGIKHRKTPGTIRTVLLGRDFLIPANIGIFVGLGGWTVGLEVQKLVPFAKTSEPFLISSVKQANEESEVLLKTGYNRPAEILASLEYDADEEIEENARKVEEFSLFPNSPHKDIRVRYDLTAEQVASLRKTLGPFLPVFTKAPGVCKAYKHRIDTGKTKPISTTLRPMSPGKRKIFDEAFAELLKHNIIEPSRSAWSANAFVLQKPGGGLRPLIDYRPINKVTVPDVYPIPRLEDMLNILGQCEIFTVFDIARGFFQIEMEEEDKPKTAFICHNGLWHYNRMPMGLCNSPSTFQRAIDEVLGDLKSTICAVYMDDICIFSKSFKEHMEHITLVLTRIMNSGFTIHPNKVQLCRTRFKYLGFIVEDKKCYPNPDKVKCVNEYPTPRKPKDIQKFLGLIGFYRRFVPEFSQHAKPLTTLIRKNIKFEWGPEAEKGFQHLKSALSDYSMVYLPDMNKPFIIQTDASDLGYGAILIQENNGDRHPIWFASRALKPAETKYSIFEKEIGALVWAINRFRGYIEYTHFTVESDHQAISWLHKIKDPTGRLGRWAMQLQMYDFKVNYRPGACNAMKGPDALSRIPETMFCESNLQNMPVTDLNRDMVIQAQDNDPKLREVKENLRESSSHAKRTKLSIKCSLSDDGLLMRYVGARHKPWEDERLHWRVWIPDAIKNEVIAFFHANKIAGHLGIRKTFSKLEQRVYWPNLRRDVQRYINYCLVCQESKPPRLAPVPATSFYADAPWSMITVHLFVIVDNFSRYVEMYPLRVAKTETIIDKLWQTFCRWGLPRSILSDNGTQFTSRAYGDWCKSLGISPFYISAYHPQANMTERYNATIKSMIVAVITRCKDWDKYIQELAFALRTSVSDSTGFTPAYINLGRELATPFENLMQMEISSFKDTKSLHKRLQIVHAVVREEIENSQGKYLKYYNAKAKPRCYKIGDLVWLKTHFLSDASRGITASLCKKREGPYKVHINELSPYLDPLNSSRNEPEPAFLNEAVATNAEKPRRKPSGKALERSKRRAEAFRAKKAQSNQQKTTTPSSTPEPMDTSQVQGQELTPSNSTSSLVPITQTTAALPNVVSPNDPTTAVIQEERKLSRNAYHKNRNRHIARKQKEFVPNVLKKRKEDVSRALAASEVQANKQSSRSIGEEMHQSTNSTEKYEPEFATPEAAQKFANLAISYSTPPNPVPFPANYVRSNLSDDSLLDFDNDQQ